MSPLELPGKLSGSRKSKNKVICPHCGTEHSEKAIIAKMPLKAQEVKFKCKNKKCKGLITYKRLKQ